MCKEIRVYWVAVEELNLSYYMGCCQLLQGYDIGLRV